MYPSVRLRGGTPSSGWSSDSDEEPPTVPRPNFDDGPIHWPAGVTKPISSAWPWQPLPADDLQSNFSIDTNDQRCIETGVRLTKRLLKRRAFPAVLTQRSLILDAYPDWEAAKIPEGLVGSCMWGWLQCALQRVATFASDKTSRTFESSSYQTAERHLWSIRHAVSPGNAAKARAARQKGNPALA